MSQPVPEHLVRSAGLQYVVSKGWNWSEATGDQIKIEECPFCHKGESKFFMAVSGDPQVNGRDGLYMCFHGSCGKTGNLRTLQEALGDKIVGVESQKAWAGEGEKKPDVLPDADACHIALLGDPSGLDYLLNVRGFTLEIINRQKLGLKEKVYFREAGEVKALVIPYLVNSNVVYAKYRTLPPSPKDFTCPTGHEAQLYNGEILTDSLREVVFVEGEADALSCMSNGITYVCGVPGANVKKATWIDTLDRLGDNLKKYILYDSDRAGIRGAQELASRIGIDKCWKITLPPFSVTLDGVTRAGKDVNEWFTVGGGNQEKFEELKQQARLFDITGVTSAKDALEQLEDILAGKTDLAPKYVTQWSGLNKLVGFEDGDVIAILAPEKVGKTTLGMNLIDHMCATYGEDGLIVCLEMTRDRLARKWVSMLTGFEDTLTNPGTPESAAKLAELILDCAKARDITRERNADLYFAYPQEWQDNPDSIFKLIKDCIRRYGIKWVMFDNLHKFCDESIGKSHANRTVYLSQLSKRFASVAKDYHIKLILILQPRQIEEGQIVQSRHTDGSSQISKDCDCMITMHRNQIGMQKKSEWEKENNLSVSDVSFEPRTKLTVALSRYYNGGHCTVYFDGARSQVREYDESLKTPMSTQKFNNLIPTEGTEPKEGESSI